MRIAIVVVVGSIVATRIAAAAPPSGYQCGAGKPKPGVGCACPGRQVEKRDADNVAICVAAPVVDNTSALFVKALETTDLARAKELALRLDGSTDTKATTALTKAFEQWLGTMKPLITSLGQRGRCASINEALASGAPYREIWANLMARLDKRNPAMQAGAMATGRIDQKLAPLVQTRDTCVADAAKQDGTERVNGRRDERLDRCLARFDGGALPRYTVTVELVVDSDGRFLKREVIATPRPPFDETRDPRACVASWLGKLTGLGTGRGYRAYVTLETGAKAVGGEEGARIGGGGKYAHLTLASTKIETKKPIMFHGGAPTLDDPSLPIVDELATLLKDHPNIQLEIQGHTDDGGNPTTVKLAQDRADAVRTRLISKGIDGTRLSARGIGSDVPMSATSRRIDLVIVAAKPAGPATKPLPGDVNLAKLRFEEGQTAYNLGNFTLAIEKFKLAYDASPNSAFLYNIAQSYRLKGDRKSAIDYYERFLAAEPDHKQAPDVRRRIDELKKQP